VYKKIQSVELCSVSMSDELSNDLFNEPYLIIDIDELNGRIHSNNENANGVFVILYLEAGKSYHKGRDFFEKIKYFDPPLSVLSTLNVKIRKQNGDLLEAKPNCSVTMMFKITSFK
jgi:hypothetical protein